MSPRIGIEGHGFPKFEREINNFTNDMIRGIKRVIAETAEMLVSQAKTLAPVDTGNLKNSIGARYFDDGLSAEVSVGADYALYIEFGTGIYALSGNGRKTPWVYFDKKRRQYVYTRGHAAQPFWAPSYVRAVRHFTNALNKI